MSRPSASREIDGPTCLDVLRLLASSLGPSDILAAEVLDDKRVAGRITFEHPHLRDGAGEPLRIDLGRLVAHWGPAAFADTLPAGLDV